jgi:hypothetical protein
MEIILMENKKKNHTKSEQSPSQNDGGIYEIKIKGLLDDHWGQWFEGMTLKHQKNGETGQDCTLIIGPIADQPALHGLLGKIRDLNLILVSVRRLGPKDLHNHKKGRGQKQKKAAW